MRFANRNRRCTSHHVQLVTIAAVVLLWPGSANAQSDRAGIEVGLHVISARSTEFDEGDVGIGGRFAWRPNDLVGIEAELAAYPSDFPAKSPFSRGRTEGLFGVTLGPRFDRLRPFAKLRPGFLTFHEAQKPVACILIFPPPLSCVLASGRTAFALDFGGGAEVFATRNTFVRVDAGDRLLKYPGPIFDRDRAARRTGRWSHDLRFALGAGLRF